MPKPPAHRPVLPTLLAATATVITGAALGLAPYAMKAASRPEWKLWDVTDPLTAVGVTIQAFAGIAVMEIAVAPLLIRPIWRELDRTIVMPHRKATEAAKSGLQWAEWSKWRR